LKGSVWLDRLRRVILRERSFARKLALTLAWLGLALALRWFLDRGTFGVPFLTFVPVVLLSALILDGRFAVLSAIVSMVLVRLLFPANWHVADPTIRTAMALFFGVTVAIIVGTGHFVRLLLIENEAHIQQAEAFNAELQHRAKNALQVIRALVGRGPAPGEDPAVFYATLLGRMEALDRANDLLHYGSVDSAPLADLVASAIAPFDSARFRCSGPACQLHKSAANQVMMALHELGTNAVKYGALSAPAGLVTITWRALGPDRLRLDWREQGGPPVTPPTTRGMGTRLLRPHGGLHVVDLDWAPTGLVCRLEMAGAMASRPPANA
jgi:two-component sensor histidine kinase